MKRRTFISNIGMASAGLALMPTACTKSEDTEILILGGGISGLYLAYMLEKVDKDYILLEGSDRFGGRMFTRTDINRDVGGRGIGDKYAYMLQLIEASGAEMIDITEYMNSPSAIYMNGKLRHPWPEEEVKPASLQYMALGKSDYLKGLDSWYKSPEWDEAYSSFLSRNGLTQEQIDLTNISANYNDIRETSALNAHHSRAFVKYNGSKRVLNFKGGTKAFIDKVVAMLSKPLHANKMVTHIDDQSSGVRVKCQDGSSYRAKKVVSTLPFTTLRDVKMNMAFNENQKKAINTLDYTNITQIHLTHSEEYWKEDGIPMGMWTDTPLERIMNMSALPDETEMACWVNGKGTAFFDKMTEKEIADFTIKTLHKMRPASKGKIEYLGTQNWGKYPYNKGAYIEFGVGQAAWFEDMIKPVGNLYFAGEHTANNNRGMEAAAESAMRVFNELMT
ncbi:flavin monoamine oxidase family protein [Costertonia aggregata]|uniref:Tryptophan 2-monooxygenase n=1 Tax=Costertonia aggregata TaxID=343403 RepID=A0A7H9ANQ7_9FLAO|nr:NAD(P)/FAD-dependent oxidoreductase [Costertonia aggregata]QLG45034.1 FAD-dependent oxidoreductase [Costertonia aggregata]